MSEENDNTQYIGAFVVRDHPDGSWSAESDQMGIFVSADSHEELMKKLESTLQDYFDTELFDGFLGKTGKSGSNWIL